jgi:hypothetical protein
VRRTLIGVGVEYRESEDFGLPVGTIWTAPLPRLDGSHRRRSPCPPCGRVVAERTGPPIERLHPRRRQRRPIATGIVIWARLDPSRATFL